MIIEFCVSAGESVSLYKKAPELRV